MRCGSDFSRFPTSQTHIVSISFKIIQGSRERDSILGCESGTMVPGNLGLRLGQRYDS